MTTTCSVRYEVEVWPFKMSWLNLIFSYARLGIRANASKHLVMVKLSRAILILIFEIFHTNDFP
jgi:hypothetical protein